MLFLKNLRFRILCRQLYQLGWQRDWIVVDLVFVKEKEQPIRFITTGIIPMCGTCEGKTNILNTASQQRRKEYIDGPLLFWWRSIEYENLGNYLST